MDEQPSQIGRYVVLERLGSGGFATVYRVRDTNLDREVALKVMRPLLLSDPTFVERFRREARVVANLDHPNIVPIYDYGDIEDRLCLVMKLLPGGSLGDRLRKGALPWDEVVRLTRQIATALDYAHERGLVHRDIKPENVLLDDDGNAVLADFGLVRALESGRLTTSLSGGVLGTPAYLAPEVWNGEPGTRFTDVYALACLVFEMATGAQLFEAPTPPATMTLHFRPPLFPETWPEGVPAGVEQVLRQALAQEPEARHPSAGAFARELAALQDDPLAGPYAALEAAIAAEKWQDAVALGERILHNAPGYRETRRLLDVALEGRVKAERAAWAAQWQAATESALQAGDWRQAYQAAQRWQQFAPEDVAAAEAIARARRALEPPPVQAAPELAATEQPVAEETLVEKVTFETPAETEMRVAAGMESAATPPVLSPGWMPAEPATTVTEEPPHEAVTPGPPLWARLRNNPRLVAMVLVGLLVVGGAITLLANYLSGGGEEETPVVEGQTVTAALGESYEGELAEGGFDSYLLDEVTAPLVAVEVQPQSGLNVGLEWYGPEGELRRKADFDAGDGLESILVTPGGKVQVLDMEGSGGAYDLQVHDPHLPGNSLRTTSGTLEGGGSHAFPFTASADDYIVAVTESPADLILELWDADQEEMVGSWDDAGGYEELVTMPGDGSFVLVVRTSAEDSSVDYRLILLGSPPVVSELAIGDEVVGAFAADVRFEYLLYLSPVQAVEMTVTPDNEADVVLQVLDTDGNELTGANNEGGGGAETLTFVAPEAAEGEDTLHPIIIEVSESEGLNEGHFTLQLAEGSPDDAETQIELAHFDSEALGLSFDYPAGWVVEEGDFDPFVVVAATDDEIVDEVASGDPEPEGSDWALIAFAVGDAAELGDVPVEEALAASPLYADTASQGVVAVQPEPITVNDQEGALASVEAQGPSGTNYVTTYVMIRGLERYALLFAMAPEANVELYSAPLPDILGSIELRPPLEEVGMGEIAVGDSVSDELSDGAAHVWHLNVEEGEVLVIAVQPGQEFDPMVDVRDGNGQSILDGGRLDSAGEGGEERVEVTFPDDGEYFVYILGYEGSTGPYTLLVEPPEDDD